MYLNSTSKEITGLISKIISKSINWSKHFDYPLPNELNQIELVYEMITIEVKFLFRFFHLICILSGLFHLKKIHLNQVQRSLWHHPTMMRMLSNLEISFIFRWFLLKAIVYCWMCGIFTFDMYIEQKFKSYEMAIMRWKLIYIEFTYWIWSKQI